MVQSSFSTQRTARAISLYFCGYLIKINLSPLHQVAISTRIKLASVFILCTWHIVSGQWISEREHACPSTQTSWELTANCKPSPLHLHQCASLVLLAPALTLHTSPPRRHHRQFSEGPALSNFWAFVPAVPVSRAFPVISAGVPASARTSA